MRGATIVISYTLYRFISCQGSEEKHFKTLKRIRKYEKDGKIVTETTSRVVDVSQEDYRNALMKEQQQRYCLISLYSHLKGELREHTLLFFSFVQLNSSLERGTKALYTDDVVL